MYQPFLAFDMSCAARAKIGNRTGNPNLTNARDSRHGKASLLGPRIGGGGNMPILMVALMALAAFGSSNARFASSTALSNQPKRLIIWELGRYQSGPLFKARRLCARNGDEII
jgi:hypothetical protein